MTTRHPRSAWTSTASGATTLLVPAEVDGVAVHHHGGDPIAPARVPAALRGWRTYHVDGRGWDDVAYNVAVDQAGGVWDLRGLRRRSAANGAEDPNRRFVAVLAILGNRETPTVEMVQGIRAVVEDVRQLYRGADAVRTHAQVRPSPTECPGAYLTKLATTGQLAPGGGPVGTAKGPTKAGTSTPPPFPLPRGSYFGPESGPDRSVSGFHGHRGDLMRWQTRMVSLDYDLEPDGRYGPETAGVARALQRRARLDVDGLVGPATWAAAWTTR